MTPSEFERLNKEVANIKGQLYEIKAMLAQQAPVRVKPTIAQEIAAITAQGLSVHEYYRGKKKQRVTAPKQQGGKA
jgi:hypothetical protein